MAANGQPSAPVQGSEDLDLRTLLTPLRLYWKRFLVTWVLVAALVLAAILCTSPSFQASGSLYIEGTKNSAGTGNMLGAMLPGFFGDSDLESQKQIIHSNTLAMKVIHKLGLNAGLEGPSAYLPPRPMFWQWKLDSDPRVYDRGLQVRQSSTAAGVHQPVSYTLIFADEHRFTVRQEGREVASGLLGQMVQTEEASFELHFGGGDEPLVQGLTFDLEITPAQGVLEDFYKALSIEGGGRPPATNNVISVAYESDSATLAPRVVDALIGEFFNLKHSWATTGSKKTLDFITDQINSLQADMDQAELQLAKFSEQTSIMRLDLTLEKELQELVETETALRKTQMEEAELEKLVANLDQGAPSMYLMAAAEEPVQSMVAQLSQINMEIAAKEATFSDDYLPLRNQREMRRELLANLRSAVDNRLKFVRNKLDELNRTLETQQARMGKLPDQARALTEYMRATKVFEELYVYLFEEQQRARIAVESTLTNLRQVDAPTIPLEASAPEPKLSVLLAGALGLLVASAVVIVPTARIRWFTSVDEVKEQVNQPVFAIVPHRGKEATRATRDILEGGDHSAFTEAMRLLRTNLLHSMAGRKHQSVLVTSALPGDGKTSISSNLAAIIARSRRVERVLLIDADMHHPALHGVFGVRQSPGLSDYLNGEATLEEVIHTVTLPRGDTVDVISAGPVPPTPADLIETQGMADLLAYAREHYTFTIVDSPPYPLVATASILASQVDRLLSVCRVGQTDRNLYRHHIHDLSQVTRSVGLVINVSAKASDHYGYGKYGYGAGYGQAAEETGRQRRRSGNGEPAAETAVASRANNGQSKPNVSSRT